MSYSLVIVESPAKAKTIEKFLGKGYKVNACYGHVIDLPEKELGVEIKNKFKPRYIVIPGKKKIINALKKVSDNADEILLATDPDREGEAIAWHVARAISPPDAKVHRVLFNQITKTAILESIKNKTDIDINKVEAQQARRILDRLVGYKVSPFLWKIIYSGLSAGRVQTVALRLVVERDVEIESFVSEEYWTIFVELAKGSGSFKAKLIKIDRKEKRIPDEESAKKIIGEITNSTFTITDVQTKRQNKNPPPPFITSTLQQEGHRRFGFGVKRTMMLAQRLYEGVDVGGEAVGLITYMRTDSTRMAGEAITWAREVIEETYGNEYLQTKPRVYKSSKGSQDAHEAIRPSLKEYPPERVREFLPADQFKLYTLIWNRFLATQMKPAVYEVHTIYIQSLKYLFRAQEIKNLFPGFECLYKNLIDGKNGEEETSLPEGLKKGDELKLKEVTSAQNFTKPSSRYTEATLVRDLESQGIGRPSTYAGIISTIINKKYVKHEKRALISTELGRNVNRLLVTEFPEIFDVKFTARMEDKLDRIESGKDSWLTVVEDFYGPFEDSLERVLSKRDKIKESFIETSDEVCDSCGEPMVIRWGKNGKFLACSGFPKCKTTRSLKQEETPVEVNCDKCSAPMQIKHGRYGRFLACTNYPECKNIKPIPIGVNCPAKNCDGDLVEKTSRKGKVFYG